MLVVDLAFIVLNFVKFDDELRNSVGPTDQVLPIHPLFGLICEFGPPVFNIIWRWPIWERYLRLHAPLQSEVVAVPIWLQMGDTLKFLARQTKVVAYLVEDILRLIRKQVVLMLLVDLSLLEKFIEDFKISLWGLAVVFLQHILLKFLISVPSFVVDDVSQVWEDNMSEMVAVLLWLLFRVSFHLNLILLLDMKMHLLLELLTLLLIDGEPLLFLKLVDRDMSLELNLT